LLAAIDDGGSYWSVWVNEDGTRVFVANYMSGLRMYDWDGANLVLLDTDDQGGLYQDVWSDGTYIYVANGTLGIMAYAVAGNALNHLATRLDGTACDGVDGDGTYIYTASSGAIPGVKAYTFNGAAFAYIATAHDGVANYWDLVFRDGYVHCACDGDGIRLYTFNGVAFAHIAQYDEPVGTAALSIGTDGYYIYSVVDNLGVGDDYIRAYSFDGAALALEYSIQHPMMVGGAGPRRFNTGNDTNFLYLPAGDDGVRIVTALYADFSIDDTTLFGNQAGQLTCHCGLPEAMGVWAYNFGDSTVSALKNPSKRYSLGGTYTITLAASRGGLTETHSITVTVGGGGLTATPSSGQGPLEVQFTDQSTGDIVSREIFFGDGDSTTELNPKHTYMPGQYTVTYIVYDNDGNRAIVTLTIYVYDADYTGAGVHIPYSTVCYRHAVKALQGVGLVPWGGQYWVWPEVYVGTAKGFDAANEPVSVVFNNATGQFFRIGIPDLWQDRVGPYAAYDIPTRIRFRELISRGGEMEQIVHREHHAHLRPYYEDNRSVAGFNRDGFLENFSVTGRLFFDGEPSTPGAILQRVPRLADYAFRQHRRVRRVQFELETNKSGYRGVGTQANIEELDKKPPPPENRKAETGWQMEFRTPDIWVSRNSTEPTQNRATGLELTGAYDILTTGPDGRGGTAMAFAPGSSPRALVEHY
jgi:PKD repeat protein